MALKTYKPTTPSQRFHQSVKHDDITRSKPEKSLSSGRSKKAGRDSQGRISVRRRGGGHKRRYREIDFKRNKHAIPGRIAEIEYDPFRSADIALVVYADGEKRYMLRPRDLEIGMTVMSGSEAPIAIGNCLPLENIPLGRMVHCVEMYPGKGAQLIRSAGASALIAAKEGKYVTLKMPSGEMRRILAACKAVIGQVGNEIHMNTSLGKAGRSRWLGKRPKVRGVVMNPVDHPHGGGEGRTSGGRHPVSPWGWKTKGYKTRKRNKPSDKFIVMRSSARKKRR